MQGAGRSPICVLGSVGERLRSPPAAAPAPVEQPGETLVHTAGRQGLLSPCDLSALVPLVSLCLHRGPDLTELGLPLPFALSCHDFHCFNFVPEFVSYEIFINLKDEETVRRRHSTAVQELAVGKAEPRLEPRPLSQAQRFPRHAPFLVVPIADTGST
ncbi:hypothetical protein TREES_T100007263 [Tupaia chinensis]|uniref:Uncharacterized protein n=1 Tax=Tupaia chinensis TaxID=246437 RepID=L9L0J6_TUPCH|nr:hypothetical protein TREES_T100007263 [Tupaia chinensis]